MRPFAKHPGQGVLLVAGEPLACSTFRPQPFVLSPSPRRRPNRAPQLSARIGGRSGRCLSIWLVDVAALGWRAFAYRSHQRGPGPAGAPVSLRGLLEDEVRGAG